MLRDVEHVVQNGGSGGARRSPWGLYMTAHWVAPQQSLMMATPDLVMDGLLGGTSRICLLGFGGPLGGRCGREVEWKLSELYQELIDATRKNEGVTHFAWF